jgi:DNA-directed RNA polymerase subunit M/transcription elongation factor TFIIS
MIDIKAIIARINTLLDEDTDQSITYAALEARLALEKVCYDRLRQRHAYISHAQLQKWQPGAVVKILMAEVDPHITQTVTLSIGKNPGARPEDDDYVEIGTEIGFSAKYLADLWNALANLALHVRLPKHQDDHISDYGDKEKIRDKVKEVVAELERLANGTMAFSGFGAEVKFVCICGVENRRRAELLHNGQLLRCINYNCDETWKATKSEEDFWFEVVRVTVNCAKCKTPSYFPWRTVCDMKYDQIASFFCPSCQHKNHMRWQLMQARSADEK